MRCHASERESRICVDRLRHLVHESAYTSEMSFSDVKLDFGLAWVARVLGSKCGYRNRGAGPRALHRGPPSCAAAARGDC